ncbi:hypothetical protein F383_33717 [Gossypium arboreum]|uniref:Uncharacterized protein n=1 Tax=Gossypium arboreum TaxID=29729 RepID=A0A0B0PNK3_GOSAR|nr:hypothetical protein F383_33717 [Gossypium arboreum]
MPSRARTSLCKKRLFKSSFTLISSSSNGRNQDDSLIKHGEYWAQHDELHDACFNASEVTTGKTNDNTNDGMVEISDDDRFGFSALFPWWKSGHVNSAPISYSTIKP